MKFLHREVAALTAEANDATGLGEFHPPSGGGLEGNDGQGLLRESMVCPVFAALPQEQQLEAFEPAPKGTRKFVLVRKQERGGLLLYYTA